MRSLSFARRTGYRPHQIVAVLAALGFSSALAGCGGDEDARARATEGLALTEAWCRATPQGATTTSCFFTAANNSAQEERLTGGSTNAADGVEVHETFVDGNVMRMRPVEAVTIPARGAVQLAPGGYVMRLVGLKAPLVAGAAVPAQLTFEHAGPQQLLFPVRIEAEPAS
ncbi:MAG: copper chaperone PCu(A)C [Proteobacteria bacterium]|nr:copper chaperone PCu(A)C [Pseudomonadota bacterium]